jgi:hypothetical protein
MSRHGAIVAVDGNFEVIALEAEDLAAEVLRLSVEPLLMIARHAKLTQAATLLEEVMRCSAPVDDTNERRRLSPVPLDRYHDAGAHEHILDRASDAFRGLHQLHALIAAAVANTNDAQNQEDQLVEIQRSMKLVALLAASEAAVTENAMKAKAEILMDWVGQDCREVTERLSLSLCRDVMAWAGPA